MSKVRSKLYNGYTISLVLHILLLLLLVLYTLKPTAPPKWHSFEWELSENEVESNPLANIGTKPGEPIRQEEVSTITPQTQVTSTTSSQMDTPSQEDITPIPSPVISPPRLNSSSTANVTVSRNRAVSNLRNIGNPSVPGVYGFSSNLEDGNGEAYIISQQKPNIVPDTEGEVFLQFKLLQNGTVNMSSVTVISYTSSAYVEAVKKVMPLWRFGFSKAYNPERQYRIRCNFIVNG